MDGCIKSILTCSTNYDSWQCRHNDFIMIFQYFGQIALNQLFPKMLQLWLSFLFHLSSLTVYFQLHSLIIVCQTFKFGCGWVWVTSFLVGKGKCNCFGESMNDCGFFLGETGWLWLVLGCVRVDVTFFVRICWGGCGLMW